MSRRLVVTGGCRSPGAVQAGAAARSSWHPPSRDVAMVAGTAPPSHGPVSPNQASDRNVRNSPGDLGEPHASCYRDARFIEPLPAESFGEHTTAVATHEGELIDEASFGRRGHDGVRRHACRCQLGVPADPRGPDRAYRSPLRRAAPSRPMEGPPGWAWPRHARRSRPAVRAEVPSRSDRRPGHRRRRNRSGEQRHGRRPAEERGVRRATPRRDPRAWPPARPLPWSRSDNDAIWVMAGMHHVLLRRRPEVGQGAQGGPALLVRPRWAPRRGRLVRRDSPAPVVVPQPDRPFRKPRVARARPGDSGSGPRNRCSTAPSTRRPGRGSSPTDRTTPAPRAAPTGSSRWSDWSSFIQHERGTI